MQLKEFDILLDIKKHNNIEYIELVQGDFATNKINISLINGLEEYQLSGTDIEIVFSKSDGTIVVQDLNNGISIVENKVSCILNTNTIASPGKVMAEVRVTKDTKLLTSSRFQFYVRKALMSEETLESTNEFPILTQLVNQTQGLISTTEGLINQVGQIEGQVPANVVADLNKVQTDLLSHKAESVSQGNPHGIDAKANKIQPSWILATLQNGWTGNLYYRRNEFYTIEFRGSFGDGTTTVGTVLFTLPVGYRPTSRTAILNVNSYGGNAVQANALGVTTSGEVSILQAPTKQYIGLDGISFEA